MWITWKASLAMLDILLWDRSRTCRSPQEDVKLNMTLPPASGMLGVRPPVNSASLDSCKLVMREIEHLKFAKALQSSVWQMVDVIVTQLEVDEVGECLGEDSWRYWMEEIETQI